MGCGSFTTSAYACYNSSLGREYDTTTLRASVKSVQEAYKQTRLHPSLNPRGVVRECVNNEEHPNTIPVILALDVTGSMGNACKEVAEALGVIMVDLYKKFKDIEICIMGIGDLAYDDAPIQISQFESDIRIAEALDKVWMEHGGGGNTYESYTAAWYMGLRHTKLDCHKQGRKGIIITMGDEALNPYLPQKELEVVTGDHLQDDVETPDLYEEASKKFDIFHIAVDDKSSSYKYHADSINFTFGDLLKDRLKISSINNLSQTICDCVSESIQGTPVSGETTVTSEGISW